MFLPITTFDRFSWLGNVAFSAEKINGNRALLRAEERDVNLYNKKCIDSVNNIHQELTIDSVKYNDKLYIWPCETSFNKLL